MKLMEAIKERRSVRNFAPTPVPEHVLEEMLEAARLAPSGGNGQNWVFGIVKEDAIKNEIVKAAGNQEWIATAPVIIACCARLEGDLKDAPEDDFGLIVNHTRFGEDFVNYMNEYPDRKMANTFWNNAVPLIPGEHMFLTAVSHGLRACWIGYMDIKKTSEILKLPEDLVCLFLLPVGYPAEDPGEMKRYSHDEIVFYDCWSK